MKKTIETANVIKADEQQTDLENMIIEKVIDSDMHPQRAVSSIASTLAFMLESFNVAELKVDVHAGSGSYHVTAEKMKQDA